MFCTCRDFTATHRLRGPKGIWYALGIKPVCHECGSSVRIAVYRFVGDEYKKWDVDRLPVIDFSNVSQLDEALLPVSLFGIIGKPEVAD
jgi:hypothetical protein